MPRIKFRWIVACFLAIYCVIILLDITGKDDFFQWDFRGFYYCAKSLSKNISPYHTKEIATVFNAYLLPYVYTPLSLYFFKIFAVFKFSAAFYLFLFVKCLSILALIMLWRGGLFERKLGIGFFVLCLFGFDRAIYLDLASGNISVLEQLFLWLGLIFYLRGRLLLFCIFTLLASSFKLQPAFFLILLFFSGNKDRYRYFIGSCVIFCLHLLLSFFMAPQFFQNFTVNVLETFSEKGIINPCTFALAQEIVEFLPHAIRVSFGKAIFILLYLPLMGGIIFLSVKTVLKIHSSNLEEKGKWLIFFVCCAYSLIAPRFKDYSYIILIPPAYFIMQRLRGIKSGAVFFILLMLSAQNATLPGAGYAVYFLWNYYPLFLAIMIWGAYIHELRVETAHR